MAYKKTGRVDVGPVYHRVNGLSLDSVLEYIQADREASYRYVCRLCQNKVPYDVAKRRHVQAGRMMGCHAQKLRDRPSPRTFLDSLDRPPASPDVSVQMRILINAQEEVLIFGGGGGGSSIDYSKVCDACHGRLKINGEECWLCHGEGIDPSK